MVSLSILAARLTRRAEQLREKAAELNAEAERLELAAAALEAQPAKKQLALPAGKPVKPSAPVVRPPPKLREVYAKRAEPVTSSVLTGPSFKCGHPKYGENLAVYGKEKQCRTCMRARARANQARYRAEAKGKAAADDEPAPAPAAPRRLLREAPHTPPPTTNRRFTERRMA